jgi:uncharacterized membrane protein YcjF (UPF0283 family)
MQAQVQKWLLAIGIAALIASESAGMQSTEVSQMSELSDAVASLEDAAEALTARQDYAQASKAYFILATARREMDQTAEACAALSKSLDDYRKSVGEDYAPANDVADEGDALTDIRDRFGCAPKVVAGAR